jgi:3-oxoacyl-[acyl-carrier protein] reductase
VSDASQHVPWRLLVFGASGAVGKAVCATALGLGWDVIAVSRTPRLQIVPGLRWVVFDADASSLEDTELGSLPAYDGVCWAQGANITDSVYSVDEVAALNLYRINCIFVVKTLRALLNGGRLRGGGARLCVVSSIWQERARQNKLSYTMTKAAVGGLVRSASVDLAAEGHTINGVLPGVLDTPMTHANLRPEQLSAIMASTLFNALPSSQSVADLITFLCSQSAGSMTGQSIAVDLGFSNARLV